MKRASISIQNGSESIMRIEIMKYLYMACGLDQNEDNNQNHEVLRRERNRSQILETASRKYEFGLVRYHSSSHLLVVKMLYKVVIQS